MPNPFPLSRKGRITGVLRAGLLAGSIAAMLAACQVPPPASVSLPPLPPVTGRGAATPRISGGVGSATAMPPAEFSSGEGRAGPSLALPPPEVGAGPADISLDFADTDIRTVAAQILGSILKVNYTIDPAVKGSATFRSARPLTRQQTLAVLTALLSENGAALLHNNGLYRVVPIAAAATAPGLAPEGGAGSSVVPLRYVSAEDLAKVLLPVVAPGARVAAMPGSNALIVNGPPEARAAVVDLARSFDVDTLRGQSYAVLPVPPGADAKDTATTLQEAFRGQAGGGLAGLVRVLPLEHAGSVLVVASQPQFLTQARRIYSLIERQQHATQRTWHVYYLQNSRADDTAYLMQRAFTPDDVTAQPTPSATLASTQAAGQGMGAGAYGGAVQGAFGAAGIGGGAATGTTLLGQPAAGATGAAPSTTGGAGANPLLGGLSPTGAAGAAAGTERMRIISDPHNNSLLVYGTHQEQVTVGAMLRKVDILPLQVRIDATVAEVTLNDNLRYGTQFFFREGDVNQSLTATAATAAASASGGFLFLATSKPVQAVISALQEVTTVRVLSAPEVMVLDNQPAELQVGDLVPYLTQSSQSTLVAGAPVVNSVNYRQTGVILRVTPRVNAGGLVTLDIAQEVSAVNAAAPTFPGVSSPTFSDREVQSRVVVQDGQTVGLGGLITDSIDRSNAGIPFLRNVPVLGLLAGQQNNTRVRTELLVLVTPHVVYDQRSARALTQDLQQQLYNAALLPAESQSLPISGPTDPQAGVVQRLGNRLGTPP